MEKLEASLWRLALLVRCQDRAQGLHLFRKEPMRKLLDTRFYEVLTRPNTRACKQTRALSCIFLFLFLGCHRLCLKVVCMHG